MLCSYWSGKYCFPIFIRKGNQKHFKFSWNGTYYILVILQLGSHVPCKCICQEILWQLAILQTIPLSHYIHNCKFHRMSQRWISQDEPEVTTFEYLVSIYSRCEKWILWRFKYLLHHLIMRSRSLGMPDNPSKIKHILFHLNLTPQRVIYTMSVRTLWIQSDNTVLTHKPGDTKISRCQAAEEITL